MWFWLLFLYVNYLTAVSVACHEELYTVKIVGYCARLLFLWSEMNESGDTTWGCYIWNVPEKWYFWTNMMGKGGVLYIKTLQNKSIIWKIKGFLVLNCSLFVCFVDDISAFLHWEWNQMNADKWKHLRGVVEVDFLVWPTWHWIKWNVAHYL